MVGTGPQVVPIPPVAPDFKVCNSWFGSNIRYFDCLRAVSGMRKGRNLNQYTVLNPLNRYPQVPDPYSTLPFVQQEASCVISVEVAGPNLPPTFSIPPDEIKGMAGYVIQQCVQSGTGGFITKNFSNMLDYLMIHEVTTLPRTYPSSSAFLTLTINDKRQFRSQQPGNYDPEIPMRISAGFWTAYTRSLDGGDQFRSWLLRSCANQFRNIGLALERGSVPRIPWWQGTSLSPVEMNYTCDISLGTPKLADCSSIEYSKLGAPSDRLTISPGVPKLISSGMCSVVVSTVSSISISWQQVHLALDALINLCISNPGQPSSGGMAHYTSQAVLPRSTRRGEGTISNLTGLNALPPHVTLTVYQPGHFSPEGTLL